MVESIISAQRFDNQSNYGNTSPKKQLLKSEMPEDGKKRQYFLSSSPWPIPQIDINS